MLTKCYYLTINTKGQGISISTVFIFSSFIFSFFIDYKMYNIKNIERFNLNQLKNNVKGSASWHSDYDSAYIYIGGLSYGMNEGDIAIVFSEFGEVVDLRVARDKVTGKSKGFAFLAYEDQRSTVLAVDNFNGAQICGRVIRVDHVKKYKPPKQFLEVNQGIQSEDYRPTGPDGKGWGKYRQLSENQKAEVQKFEKQKSQLKKFNQKQKQLV